jgi:hypothetical protein
MGLPDVNGEFLLDGAGRPARAVELCMISAVHGLLLCKDEQRI